MKFTKYKKIKKCIFRSKFDNNELNLSCRTILVNLSTCMKMEGEEKNATPVIYQQHQNILRRNEGIWGSFSQSNLM